MQNKNMINIVLTVLVILGFSYVFINKDKGNNILSNTSSSTTKVSTSTTNSTTTDTNSTNINITNAIKIGQRVPYNGIYITPLQVSYDGRCPIDAKCTQPSTFDLGVLLEGNSTTQNVIITSNKAYAFADKKVTLTSITPAKSIKRTLTPKDYRFTFKVTY